MVVGSFVSGGTTTPNFTRFAKGKETAVFTTVVAFLIGNSLMFAFGAVGGAFTGKDDIFYVMMAQGLLLPALVVLGANIWTTNDNALYSGGLSLSNITGIRKRPLVIVSGVIGTAASVYLYNNFVSWLSFLNATLPPIGAIIIFDYFGHPQHYEEGAEAAPGVHWGAVAGVIAGALTGNFLHAGIASINAMIVGCFCYLVYNKAAGR
jgi:cytosine permease